VLENCKLKILDYELKMFPNFTQKLKKCLTVSLTVSARGFVFSQAREMRTPQICEKSTGGRPLLAWRPL